MRIKIETLGCKVNGVESESIAELFRKRGHEIVKDNADVVVINTCCVTGEAEAKSRQAIRKALKAGAEVAVMGCYGQLAPDTLKEIGVSVIVGTSERKSIVNKVEEIYNQHKSDSQALDMSNIYEDLPHVPSKTRAFMKIQDGCNGKCTYCIIPTVRGKSRSRSLKSIIQECQTLSDYKEIVITGINLGQYGTDLGLSLTDAIRTVLNNTSARVRLSSVEPDEVTEELINLIKDEPRICKHLHIPVQSCSDAVLKVMHRKYTVNDFKQMVNRLHDNIPTMMIGIDIILGFPSETDEMFEDTLNCLRELPISHFHVFGYSPRKGTLAAEMEQVSPIVKKARVDKILTLAAEKKSAYHDTLISSEVEVLTERTRKHFEGIYTEGHSSEYVKVYIKGEVPLNEIITVKLTEVFKDGIIGVVDN
ncbi:MAG: tRNA (N(6)-L-threonylcarbamoyladenosine(37)-C(2))-methylthiotransferase MtaB [Selenomonadaceae bacterium]|nr:tRNA (N(6)-L-threonylcarbamoyladenosine(37)-C(2))-methylthiotransferase MtaB [Selenomonadaceae bacterium]